MARLIASTLALLALLGGQVAAAQSWTTAERTPTWTTTPVVGDGVDRHPEVSNSTQGGDPVALDYEPAIIDESTNYTRSQWLEGGVSYNTSSVSPKARFTCNHTHFANDDPILYFSQAGSAHHHDFIGNFSTNHNSTYATLRNNPKSACAGGPVNATGYWEPALMYELTATVSVPLKPNNVTFYYQMSHTSMSPPLYRLLRGLAFIGGVDPSDRLNTARQTEIPDNEGWLKEADGRRYNGWTGWACFNDANVLVSPAVGNTADESPNALGYLRQLVNEDGTDPWGGACEGTDKVLIANMNAPACWDGHNLTSTGGRDHFRYPIIHSSDQAVTANKCPDGWWRVPQFEVKTEFANGRPGISGHAWRSKLYLSSDRHGRAEADWHPRGSTFHFDWMNGWDSVVMETWLNKCIGVEINGTAGTTADCDNSTISSTQRLSTSAASPDPNMSADPPVSFYDFSTGASKDAFGPITEGSQVTITVEHSGH
jgi:hypothetical protein